MTALHYATKYGQTGIVRLLIDNKCNVDVQDKEYGTTALHKAALKGYTEIVKLLIANKCNVDVLNKGGDTDLQIAKRNGHKDIVNLLKVL